MSMAVCLFQCLFAFYSRDALRVKCKVSTGQTCIIPKPSVIHMNSISDEGQGHQWFSDMDDGYTVSKRVFVLI